MALTDKEPMRTFEWGAFSVAFVRARFVFSMVKKKKTKNVGLHVRVRKKKKNIQNFYFTAFFSWRHLLPSLNLSVYQAKGFSKRLLRQLDNPPFPIHTPYRLPPSSQHPACPIIYRKNPQKLQSPVAPHRHTLFLRLHTECCATLRQCGGRTQRLKIWKRG